MILNPAKIYNKALRINNSNKSLCIEKYFFFRTESIVTHPPNRVSNQCYPPSSNVLLSSVRGAKVLSTPSNFGQKFLKARETMQRGLSLRTKAVTETSQLFRRQWLHKILSNQIRIGK